MKTIRFTLPVILMIALLVFSAEAQPGRAQLKIMGPTGLQMAEGKTYYIKWATSGVQSISLTAEGILTSRPSAPRGPFSLTLAKNARPTDMVAWTIPYLDTVGFQLHAVGYDSFGRPVAEDYHSYVFRPKILRTRTANGIYIDLGNPERQRMYVLRNNVVIRAYLTSGARTHVAVPKGRGNPVIFDPVGVFRVEQKIPMYWSRLYQVWMTNALRFYRGHFIHGTEPEEYQYLGTPASSGCIRLDRTDAKELYDMTPIGTRVEVFPY